MKKRYFITVLMFIAMILFINTDKTMAMTYYEICEDNLTKEGLSEDGYKIIKVSSQMIEKNGAYKAIQAALDDAKDNATEQIPYKIVVEPGEYIPDGCLRLYSNTYLYIEGVTLKQHKDYLGNIIKIGDGGKDGDSHLGYYYKNITIYGGTCDKNGNTGTIIKAAHAKNFALYNVTIMNNFNSHGMEIAGIDGFTVKGCTFKDLFTNKRASDANEAIQIDILIKGHINGYAFEVLSMKNISITNNTFCNVTRGVGAHTAWYGLYTENVDISNNTFERVKDVAIECLNYYNCTIKNNTMTKCGRGISVDFMTNTDKGTGVFTHNKKYQIRHDAKTIISNNTMSVIASAKKYVPCGIFVHGNNFKSDQLINDVSTGKKYTIPKNNYYISGVKVDGNTINSEGFGIRFQDVRNSKIENNKITISDATNSFHAIVSGEKSYGNTVNKNTIAGSFKNGVLVYESSQADAVTNNIISGTYDYGVDVCSGEVKLIKGNTINTPKAFGIFIKEKSNVTSILSNKILSSKRSGIYGSDSTVATISANTITSPKEHGACFGGVNITSFTGNVINAAGKNGVYMTLGKTGSITSNKITSAGANGIAISSQNVNSIKKNTVNKAKKSGIYIGEGAKVISVNSNSITAPVEKGIIVYYDKKKAGVKEIAYNKIVNAKGNGISIQGTVWDMTVKKNTITGCGGHGIILAPKDVTHKINISGNSIAGIKSEIKNGIQITKAYVNVMSNTITKFGWAVNASQGSSKGCIYSDNSYSSNYNNKARICGNASSLKVKKLSTPVISTKSYTSKGVKLKWKKVSSATEYNIYRATKRNGTYKKIAVVKSSKSMVYIDSKAKNGKKYYYKIVAIGKVSGNKVYIKSETSKVK